MQISSCTKVTQLHSQSIQPSNSKSTFQCNSSIQKHLDLIKEHVIATKLFFHIQDLWDLQGSNLGL